MGLRELVFLVLLAVAPSKALLDDFRWPSAQSGGPLGDDPVIKLGQWTRSVYRATWRSSQPAQFDYVHSNTGFAYFAVNYNTSVTNKVAYRFKILENFQHPNRYIIGGSNFTLTSDQATELRDSTKEAEVFKVFQFALDGDPATCDLESSFQLTDRKGVPIPVSSPATKDIIIKSTIKSVNCKIDLAVDLELIEVNWFQALLFVLIEGTIALLIGWPFLMGARYDSIDNCHFLSTEALICNIAIDFGILFTNMLLGNQILLGYQGFFLVLTFLKMVNAFTKVRAFIQLSEMRVGDNGPDASSLITTLLKMFFAVFALSFVVRHLLVYYWFWLIVFMYPTIQIYHNCFYVSRKNAFTFRSHFVLFLGQTSYILLLRGWKDSFLGFPGSLTFCAALVGIVLLQLLFMYLQSRLGTAFFLPASIRNNMVIYKKNPAGPKFEGKDCSICLMSLSEGIEGTQEGQLLERVIETPCAHLFHQSCLGEWMEKKMSCPVCRTKLPPDHDD